MATSLDNLISLANLSNTIRGTKSTQRTSGGTQTQTQRRDVDQAGVDRIVQRLTSGQGGQAAISGAARGAGLYNSSTERMLLNDLNARVAGEVANITAPTTTTTETSPTVTTIEQPGAGLSGIITPLAIASVAKGPLAGLLGLDGGAAGSVASGAASLLDGSRSLTDMFDLTGTVSSAVPTLDNLVAGPGLAASLGTDFAQLTPAVNAFSQIPVLGPLLSGITGGFDDQFGLNLGLGGLSGIIPAAMTNPITAVIAPVMGLLSSLFGGGLSVVCTALHQRGLLDKAEYEAGSEYLQSLHKYTIKGYYFWGKPLAAKITEGSTWATKLALPWATQRTKLLAGTAPKWKLPLGLLTKYVGEPACYALGWALTKIESLKGESNAIIRAYQAK